VQHLKGRLRTKAAKTVNILTVLNVLLKNQPLDSPVKPARQASRGHRRLVPKVHAVRLQQPCEVAAQIKNALMSKFSRTT
jgi:hypothetical protein